MHTAVFAQCFHPTECIDYDRLSKKCPTEGAEPGQGPNLVEDLGAKRETNCGESTSIRQLTNEYSVRLLAFRMDELNRTESAPKKANRLAFRFWPTSLNAFRTAEE